MAIAIYMRYPNLSDLGVMKKALNEYGYYEHDTVFIYSILTDLTLSGSPQFSIYENKELLAKIKNSKAIPSLRIL